MSTSLTPKLRGVLSPVLTPFEADGAPSVPRFIEHCRTLLNHDVGLAIFGTNSEATSMSVKEKRALLDAILAAGMPAARMMPGVGTCNLDDTVELARHAVAAGCGGVLMLPPFFYKGVSTGDRTPRSLGVSEVDMSLVSLGIADGRQYCAIRAGE